MGEKSPIPDIFSHSKFSSYFAAYLEFLRVDQPSFSYRKYCRTVGIKSPAMLTWLASGERIPSNDILEKLSQNIGWTAEEFAYIHAIVGMQKTSNAVEKEYFRNQLLELSKGHEISYLNKPQLYVFQKWYVAAILEMMNLKQFREDPLWIAEKLDNKVTVDEVSEVLTKLIDIQLLERNSLGKLVRCGTKMRTKDQDTVTAGRRWNAEMMRHAQRAVHMQPPSERFVSGVNLTISSDKIPQAQALLSEFRERFVQLTETDQGDETYHFSTQFFRLTALEDS